MPKKTTKAPVAKKVVKKTVKKTTKKVTKKVTPKKAATGTKKKKVKMLVCAPEDKCFWTTDGQILSDLSQLKLAFGTMDDEVFLHHVTKEKNDFADWVEHVLDDPECAEILRKTKKPKTAQTAVVRCLRAYKI